jgi:protein-S-isoprenylcysteine O-methyltransferase Ste14
MDWHQPVGVPQLVAFGLVLGAGAIALIRTFARSRGIAGGGRRSGRSRLGIGLQAVGFALAGSGRIDVALPWYSTDALVSTFVVALIGGTAVWLFTAAASEMGRNWSVVARTRADHQLVRTGPFGIVRHPIYLAMWLYLFSLGVAFGHWLTLLIGLPFFLAGTLIRVREEEKLLRAQFGEDHARYVREVPAFIPYIR